MHKLDVKYLPVKVVYSDLGSPTAYTYACPRSLGVTEGSLVIVKTGVSSLANGPDNLEVARVIHVGANVSFSEIKLPAGAKLKVVLKKL